MLSLPVALLRFSLLWKHAVFNPPSEGGCRRPSEIPVCHLSLRVRAGSPGFLSSGAWPHPLGSSCPVIFCCVLDIRVLGGGDGFSSFSFSRCGGCLGDSSGPQLELSCSASVQSRGGAELASPSLALSLVGTPPLTSSWLLSWLPHSGSAADSERRFLFTCPPTALPWAPL